MKHLASNPHAGGADTCEMPDHGFPEATAPCCRPNSPEIAPDPHEPGRHEPSSPRSFWSDRAAWRKASTNTFNCLVGCMIGDLGVIIGFQLFHPTAPMSLTMPLAMVAGVITSILLESSILHWREGFPWRRAVSMAFSMSFISMLAMEGIANATDFMLTGGRVPLTDPFYWQALALSIAAGFLAPLPYNYWQFKRHGRSCH